MKRFVPCFLFSASALVSIYVLYGIIAGSDAQSALYWPGICVIAVGVFVAAVVFVISSKTIPRSRRAAIAVPMALAAAVIYLLYSYPLRGIFRGELFHLMLLMGQLIGAMLFLSAYYFIRATRSSSDEN